MADFIDYEEEEIIIDDQKVVNSNFNNKIMRPHCRSMGVFYCDLCATI